MDVAQQERKDNRRPKEHRKVANDPAPAIPRKLEIPKFTHRRLNSGF